MPFTDEEIQQLWDSKDLIPFADMVLIGIYSGWRPQELSILQITDIDLEAGTMKGGLKTDAGKNRIVPIHPVIKPLIENRMLFCALPFNGIAVCKHYRSIILIYNIMRYSILIHHIEQAFDSALCAVSDICI